MTYDQINDLFKRRYSQSDWKRFLGESFANARLLATPQILTGIDSHVASQVQKLGYISLNENGIDRQIAVYEVTLAQGIVLERNRVGLRNLLRKYWKDIDAAFITYHKPESPKWRFTYVSELTGYNAAGEFIKIRTEPKRFTYVLGEGERTRTAAERFAAIANKGSKTTLDDVKEAFSVEKLSKAFFDDYKKQYVIFRDFMVSKPNIRQTIFNGDEKGIRDFSKKLLGRIVFLYFIQKKGWLGVPESGDWGKGDFNFLTNQFNQSKNPDLFYQEFLSPLFFQTLNQKREHDVASFLDHSAENWRIPYLNGGLFEEEDPKHRSLIFDANLFKNLFDFFNQHNFTIYEDDPNDHTVAVDPEMLGHIFENLLEDNKDKAYYTPKEIVHYMCQESIIEYLITWFGNKGYEIVGHASFGKEYSPELFPANEGRKGQMILEVDSKSAGKKIDRTLIEKLLKKKLDEEDIKLIKKYSAEFHTALDRVKICDPAIGSGAFPMGLLHEIFTAKQTLHIFEHGNTKTFDASAVKLNIIQNSIYGVDIERGAVDIARLRFWLSLIVDEEKPKALPNLDYKIVVGNSLVSKLGDDIIDIDWTLNETAHGLFGADLAKQKSDLLQKISIKQKEFFSPESNKKTLAADIRDLKIEILITQLQLMVKTQGIETQPTAAGKAIAKQTEQYLKTVGWKNSIKDLQKIKNSSSLEGGRLHFFDWKLDFPEVMNEYLFDTDSNTINSANAQIIALNKQIDAVNLHLFSHNADVHLIHLQANIAQSQITIIQNQLQKVEKGIHEIYGTLVNVDSSIVQEPDLSFGYKVTAINKGIEEINTQIETINPIIRKQNPAIGFDIIIANPPYIDSEAMINTGNEDLRIFLSNKLSFCKGNWDIYIAFFEFSFSLLNANGGLAFITPDKWISKPFGDEIRKGLKDNFVSIAEAGRKVFENAKVDSIITFISKCSKANIKIDKFVDGKAINFSSVDKLSLIEPYAFDWLFSDFVSKINEIDKFPNRLSDYAICENACATSDAYKIKNYLLNTSFDSEKHLKIINTGTIGRYVSKWGKREMTYLKDKYLQPVVNKEEFQEDFSNSYGIKSILPKLIIKGLTLLDGCIDFDGNIIPGKSTLVITKPQGKENELLFPLALVNSKISLFYIKEKYRGSSYNQGINFNPDMINNLPVPLIGKSTMQLVIMTIKEIIKRCEDGRDTILLEQELNHIFYKLYELTYGEVKVIDPAFGLSEEEYEAIELE